MPYGAQITRTNPACLLFLIDQSGSMGEPVVGGTGQTKAAVVADAVNRLIQNVVLRSAKADGVRDYFRVGVIGYGKGIKAGLGGSVPFEILIPVSRVGNFPLRVETRKKLIPDGPARNQSGSPGVRCRAISSCSPPTRQRLDFFIPPHSSWLSWRFENRYKLTLLILSSAGSESSKPARTTT